MEASKQIGKTFTCHLIEKKYLKKVKICLEFEEEENEEKAIAFFNWEKLNAIKIKIKYEDIEDIREGRKTDAWINAEAGLDDMLDKAPIDHETKRDLVYFSIVCKSNQGILPGETKDFVTADEQFVEELRELSHKLKVNIQLLRNVPEEDCLFDSNLSHDMDQPMSHYFIASSHNTYLTGNQMTSKSSYEIYRNILRNGSRCIEIDIWEGKSVPFEPVVTHKFTSYLKLTTTSEILLGKVLEIINEFAFTASDYPLILSIENHLEKQSQTRLAKMLYETFGNKLYIGEIGESETQYPRLSDMKNKIFIKDYKKWRIEPKFKATNTDQSVKVDDSENVDSAGPSTDETCGELDNDKFNLSDDHYDYDEWDSDEEDAKKRDQSYLDEASSEFEDGWKCWKEKSVESLDLNYHGPTYPEMINYFEANKFKDIDTCIDKFKFNQMFSRKETMSLKILEQSMSRRENKYRKFTRRNMVRVYPRSSSQDSSNYNPVRHWYAGAQMVALN